MLTVTAAQFSELPLQNMKIEKKLITLDVIEKSCNGVVHWVNSSQIEAAFEWVIAIEFTQN